MSIKCRGAIFDLDGVLTQTAKIHAKAWKEMFDEFLKNHYSGKNKQFVLFDEKEDYLKYVDGKPRYNGVREFLKSRKIEIPYGKPSDPISMKTISGLGNKKNKIYLSMIKKEKLPVFKSSIDLIDKFKKSGIKVAVVSSSKNARLVLKRTGLFHLFKIIVDGAVAEKANLSGKPNPDIFLYAAKKLGLGPSECVIFEDAISGVKAGINGNFGMVVGISRNNNKLPEADVTVKDLKELSFQDVCNWFKRGVQEDGWLLKYHSFMPKRETLRETLCTVGNGYIGTRGCFETQREFPNHYPGCYLAGIYNEQVTYIKGKKARNNSLVNCPNWLLIQIKIGKSDFIDPFKMEILDYKKILDTKKATLYHKLIFKDRQGHITQIESVRLASMNNPHICAIRFKVKPLNYSENITLRSSIDGSVENHNVARYRGLKSRHLKVISKGKTKKGFFIHVKTNRSNYEIVMAAKNNFKNDRSEIKQKKKIVKGSSLIGEEITFKIKENHSYSLEKIVTIYTSLDAKKPKEKAISLLNQLSDFESILKKHENAWKKLWILADMYIEGDRYTQRILRMHAYHLLSTFSPHVENLDVGIPARGLHGEGYHGHIFWDELFTLPFFIHRFPDTAKAALMYRCRRLNAAKEYAKAHGYGGAMYPWQSADTGREETQTLHYNPQDNSWGPDYSRNQRHISITVFYNFYKYLYHTTDKEFLFNHGIGVMVEIARFWASIAQQNKKTGKYHIKGVMGPDEFHEKYPKTKKSLNDNAYTNVMVSWLMEKVLEVIKELPNHTKKRLNIKEQELQRWNDISENLNIVIKNGIIMQFDGFDKLKDLDWEYYIKKYKNIRRLDRILKKENKNPDNYKVLKQADALMIFYVLDFKEAMNIIKRLGIKIKDTQKFLKENYNYYSSITTHGSSLSEFVHDAISTNLKKTDNLWEYFTKALSVDLLDTQEGTTSEGIHCGLMAGTINTVRKYLAGIRTYSDRITIKPYFPSHWKKFKFRIVHQGLTYHFDYTPAGVLVTLESKKGRALVCHNGKKYYLTGGSSKYIKNIKNFDSSIKESHICCYT